ncbi:hypothetical protein Tco_0619829 [Tanacetum coccineum]
MPKAIHRDHQDTAFYILKYHQSEGLSEKDKAIFKNLERRFFHEGRVVHTSYLEDSVIPQVFSAINFDCILHIDEEICEGACMFTVDWSIASFQKSIDPNPVYHTPLDDPVIVRDAIFNNRPSPKRRTKKGETIFRDPFQMELTEMKLGFRK